MKKTLWLVPVILILALVQAVTTSVTGQDDLAITLNISPRSVKEGETVYITAVVTTDTEGTYTVVLKIDDEVEETKQVTLEAGQNKTVDFEVTGYTAGDYIVDVNGASDFFSVTKSFWGVFPPYLWAIIGAIIGVLVLFIIVLVVLPPGRQKAGAAPKMKGAGRRAPSPAAPTPTPTPTPGPAVSPTAAPTPMPMTTPTAAPAPTPSPTPAPMAAPHAPPTARAIFSVGNLTITPNQVKQGEPVTISAIVYNSGTESGNYSLVLRIGGVVEGINELVVPAGTSQAAVFTVNKDTAGTYYTEVDGLAGTFTVIALVPANFSVSNLVVSPERVKQGDTVMISAVVVNTGEVAGAYSVVLKVKGVAESIEEVSLGPGGSQRVAFEVAKDAPGFYQVDLEGLIGRFVVEMEWNE